MIGFKKFLVVAAVGALTFGVFAVGSSAAFAYTSKTTVDGTTTYYDSSTDTTTSPADVTYTPADDSSYDFNWTYSDSNGSYEMTAAEAQAAASVGFAALSVIMLPLLCVGLVFYVYFGVALMTIAKKVGVENGWMAFIPILSTYLMNEIAGLDTWMFLLAFVPGVNFVYMIYVYMKIAERRGFENWVGLLMLVPVVDFFIPAYLAWGTPSGAAVSAPVAGPVEKK